MNAVKYKDILEDGSELKDDFFFIRPMTKYKIYNHSYT